MPRGEFSMGAPAVGGVRMDGRVTPLGIVTERLDHIVRAFYSTAYPNPHLGVAMNTPAAFQLIEDPADILDWVGKFLHGVGNGGIRCH